MSTRLTEGEKTLIRVLYVEKQKTPTQIAAMVDRSETTINEWINRLGIRRQDEMILGGKVYKRLTPDQEQSICDSVRDGELPSEVARKHNLTGSRVRSVLERHNVKGPVQTLGYHYSRTFSPDEDAAIRVRVEAGTSRTTIAKEYGVSDECIRSACRRAGLLPGQSAKEKAVRNGAYSRIAVRSTLTIEQTASVLGCTEQLVRVARIRHAKNPGPIKSPDRHEQKIMNSLNVGSYILAGLYGVQPKKIKQSPSKREVIVSDIPPTVSEQIVSLRMEGKLVTEIASILKIDPAEVRTALQSRWCKVKSP
jgi:transposase